MFVQASCCPIGFVRRKGKRRPREEATRDGSCVCLFARVGVHVSVWWGVGGHYPKYFKCVVFALQREMHHLHSFCNAFISVYLCFVYFVFVSLSLAWLRGVKV